MEHLGRHPNRYHEFVLKKMNEIDVIAAGDQETFLHLYDLYVKQVILSNPGMLRKWWWKQ